MPMLTSHGRVGWDGLLVWLLLSALAVPVAQAQQSASSQNQLLQSASEILSRLPADVTSPDRAFVIACNGESFLYNLEKGVVKSPFLSNVYKPFGFSHDGAFFLYLKANGRLPTFALHVYDIASGNDRLVAPDRVYNAAWSPASLQVAFISMESATRFHLHLHDLSTGTSARLFSGWLDPDFLEWSPDGKKLAYRSQIPLTENYFLESAFDYKVHEYTLDQRSERIFTGAVHAQYVQDTLLYASDRGIFTDHGEQRTSWEEGFFGQGDLVNFRMRDRAVYFTVARNGPKVEKFDPETGQRYFVVRG